MIFCEINFLTHYVGSSENQSVYSFIYLAYENKSNKNNSYQIERLFFLKKEVVNFLMCCKLA